MDDELAAFLAPLTPFATEETLLTDYLADGQPPLPCVTSSRAVLIDGDDVLIVRDPGRASPHAGRQA